MQVGPTGMAFERGGDIAAHRVDLEAMFAGICNQRFDQLGGDPAPADLGRDQRVFGGAHSAVLDPGEPADRAAAGHRGTVFARGAAVVAGDGDV